MRLPKSKMLDGRKRAKPKRLGVVPESEDGAPIGDGAGKLETTAIKAAMEVKDRPVEFTVSPFRILMAARGEVFRTGQHIPTEQSRRGVMYAAGLGMTHDDIAGCIGISPEMLRRHYREELDTAQALMMNDIATNMYNIARDPNHKGTVTAAMYMLSRLGGRSYKDKQLVEMSGPDGKPFEIDQKSKTIDPNMLTGAQRDALRDIISSALNLAQQPAPAQIEGDYTDVTDGGEDE